MDGLRSGSAAELETMDKLDSLFRLFTEIKDELEALNYNVAELRVALAVKALSGR